LTIKRLIANAVLIIALAIVGFIPFAFLSVLGSLH
jgi:hypothetical protein